MAGIGFVLRKLFHRNDLSGVLQAYMHAIIATSGPWLFTVASLGSLYIFTRHLVLWSALDDFKAVILYNFAFSLVFTAPITVVVTRFLSDCIYRRDLGPGSGLLFGSLTFLLILGAPFAALFYFFYANFTFPIALLAVVNFLVISMIWIVTVFISALKYYLGITLSFIMGMIAAVFFASTLAQPFSTAGMLFGYNAGLLLIIASLLALIMVEYPYSLKAPFAFVRYFKKHWELALGALFYSMAIWVDKWVMWFSPDAVVLPNHLIYYPYYDSAMFVATLTIIPAMAMFMLSQETSFFELYFKFYRDIQENANFDKIRANGRKLEECIAYSGRNLLILQTCICTISLFVAPLIFPYIGLNFVQMGIFRNGLLGSSFQVLALFLMILLAYFENRRGVLFLQATFFFTNALFSFATMKMGFVFYGYGYFLSTLLTFLLSAITLERYLRKLPYYTFVKANEAIYTR